jgi:hypothetical protein
MELGKKMATGSNRAGKRDMMFTVKTPGPFKQNNNNII